MLLIRIVIRSLSGGWLTQRPRRARALCSALVTGVLGAGSVVGSGCATAPKHAGPGGPAIEGMGDLLVDEAPGLTRIPLKTRFAAWEVGDGASTNEGVLTYERMAHKNGHRGAWWTVDRLVDAELVRREHFLRIEDGSVALGEITEVAEDVTVVFDPPLVTVPSRLTLGEPVDQRLRMWVHPGATPDRSRRVAEGPARSTVELVGWERVTTPLGEFDAAHVRATLRANLSGSRVKNLTDLWIAPELGLIGEVRSELTTVLGIPIRENHSSWVVAERDASGASDQDDD